MLFDEEFLAAILEDPTSHVLDICEIVKNSLDEHPEGWTNEDYEALLEAFALLTSLEEEGLILSVGHVPALDGVKEKDCSAIYRYIDFLEEEFRAEESKLKLKSFKSRFKANLGSGFCYEFSKGDLDRIQLLINELRQQISNSDFFETDHKRRLLSRLEKLQSELHKKMSNLDMLYGFIGDAGVVLGKFGEDVKPIVDRIREMVDIVWRTQARAEELPSDMPFPKLEDKSGETEIV